MFRDITTLIKESRLFNAVVNKLANKFKNKNINKVVAVEARGFILGGAIAYKLKAGFVPVRKKGKLPHKTKEATYQLEYGTDALQIHEDAIKPQDNVLIVDDLLATGGTAAAVCDLVTQLQGKIAGIVFLIELKHLKGREKLKEHELYSLIRF